MSLILFIAALALLSFGADVLVRGAVRIAARLEIPSLVIGLTVVAFGTSAPEFGVSIQSTLAGQGSIALGNVVGSNIFNVLLILGVSALITPLVVSQQLVRVDVPVMIAVSLLVWLMGYDGNFGRVDGIVLFAGLIVYTSLLIYFGRKQSSPPDALDTQPQIAAGLRSWAWDIALVAGGVLLLVLGANWLVGSAVTFAQWMGVSEQIIGLTIVAAGTSLPEVITSIVASLRGERDIAVGNVVGSNLFNLLGVLGLTAAVAPQGIAVSPAMLTFDLPIMIAVAVVCLPMFFTGGMLARWEGGLLLVYYIAYTIFLILAATKHDALAAYSAAMLYFAMPLTLVTLAVTSWNAWRRNPRTSSAQANDE